MGEVVDFGEDVEVREIHLQHAAEGEDERGDIEGGAAEDVRVCEVEDYELEKMGC